MRVESKEQIHVRPPPYPITDFDFLPRATAHDAAGNYWFAFTESDDLDNPFIWLGIDLGNDGQVEVLLHTGLTNDIDGSLRAAYKHFPEEQTRLVSLALEGTEIVITHNIKTHKVQHEILDWQPEGVDHPKVKEYHDCKITGYFKEVETSFSISDLRRDSDGDGLTDLFEGLIGTDPNNADCDDDGIVDGRDAQPLVDASEMGYLERGVARAMVVRRGLQPAYNGGGATFDFQEIRVYGAGNIAWSPSRNTYSIKQIPRSRGFGFYGVFTVDTFDREIDRHKFWVVSPEELVLYYQGMPNAIGSMSYVVDDAWLAYRYFPQEKIDYIVISKSGSDGAQITILTDLEGELYPVELGRKMYHGPDKPVEDKPEPDVVRERGTGNMEYKPGNAWEVWLKEIVPEHW